MDHSVYLAPCIKANTGEEAACNWHSPCKVLVCTDTPNKIALSEPSSYIAPHKINVRGSSVRAACLALQHRLSLAIKKGSQSQRKASSQGRKTVFELFR